jgi:hypothetical protein
MLQIIPDKPMDAIICYKISVMLPVTWDLIMARARVRWVYWANQWITELGLARGEGGQGQGRDQEN